MAYTKQELEATPAPILATRCGKVSENTSVDSDMREAARKLVTEWTLLQRPPNPNLAEQRKLEAEQAAQKARMVDFLVMF